MTWGEVILQILKEALDREPLADWTLEWDESEWGDEA